MSNKFFENYIFLLKLCDLAPIEVNETSIDIVIQSDKNDDQITEILVEVSLSMIFDLIQFHYLPF